MMVGEDFPRLGHAAASLHRRCWGEVVMDIEYEYAVEEISVGNHNLGLASWLDL